MAKLKLSLYSKNLEKYWGVFFRVFNKLVFCTIASLHYDKFCRRVSYVAVISLT